MVKAARIMKIDDINSRYLQIVNIQRFISCWLLPEKLYPGYDPRPLNVVGVHLFSKIIMGFPNKHR